MAARRALKQSWAMHHPTRTIGMLGATATTRMPSEPPSRPITIQGRRIPSRDVVRSLSLPQNGLLKMANAEPTPVIRARLFGARSMPTRELTFSARETRRGARNSRVVPKYAKVYRLMKTPPTRCTGADRFEASLSGGSVLQSVERMVRRRMRAGPGGLLPGPGIVGHGTLLEAMGAGRLPRGTYRTVRADVVHHVLLRLGVLVPKGW